MEFNATLMANGIMFKIEEQQAGLPEIISEETFVELLMMADDDDLPTSIDEQGMKTMTLTMMVLWRSDNFS